MGAETAADFITTLAMVVPHSPSHLLARLGAGLSKLHGLHLILGNALFLDDSHPDAREHKYSRRARDQGHLQRRRTITTCDARA